MGKRGKLSREEQERDSGGGATHFGACGHDAGIVLPPLHHVWCRMA